MEKEIERSIEEKIQRMKAYLDGMLSPEEEAEFLYWIDSSPKNKALLERVRDERVLLEKIRFRERNDLEKGWDSIQKKIRKLQPQDFLTYPCKHLLCYLCKTKAFHPAQSKT